MPRTDDFPARLDDAMARAGYTGWGRIRDLVDDLRRAGVPVSPQGARKWLSGEARPTLERIEAIVTLLGRRGYPVRGEWLLTGAEPRTWDELVTTQARPVPLIDWADIPDFDGDAPDALMQPCPEPIGPHGFAVTVIGDSMRGTVEPGQILYADPDEAAADGRLVLVCDSGHARLRRLIVEPDGSHYLEATNPDWPRRYEPLTDTARIAAVAVFVLSRL